LANSRSDYAVRFMFRDYNGEYDHCYGRAIFNHLKDAAIAIDLWVAKNIDITMLQDKFNGIEVFTPYSYMHENPLLEFEWVRAQNRLFARGDFWLYPGWELRYNTMLLAAKQRKEFKKLYPFMSVWWLRFGKKKGLKEVWPLDLYIVPTYPDDDGFNVGYVSKNEDGSSCEEKRLFKDIHSALDFYANQLSITPLLKF